MFTFKEGADLLPAGDTALLGVLPESRLQQKQRDPAGKQEEYIWDKKYT